MFLRRRRDNQLFPVSWIEAAKARWTFKNLLRWWIKPVVTDVYEDALVKWEQWSRLMRQIERGWRPTEQLKRTFIAAYKLGVDDTFRLLCEKKSLTK